MFNLIEIISKDYIHIYGRKMSALSFIKTYLLYLNFRVLVRYRVQKYLYSKNTAIYRVISHVIRNGTYKKYGIEIGSSSQIGPGLIIHHLNGVVIGEGVVIGSDVNLYQQVTLGAKNHKYPKIGDNVKIYPGSKIIGDVSIGNNVVIGANSLISKSIDENGIAYGTNIVRYPESSYYEKENS